MHFCFLPENNSDDPDKEVEEEEEEELGSIAVLSDCLFGDTNLFDTPVHNAVEETSLVDNGMENWQKVEVLSDEFDYIRELRLMIIDGE